MKIPKLGGSPTPLFYPSSMPPRLVSLCLGAPPLGTKQGAAAVGTRGASGPGVAAQRTMRNYQLQGAGISSIGKKRGAAAGTPNFKLRKPTGWRPSGKKPPSQGEKKKGGDATRPPGPGGEPCAHTGPRPRGPLPRLLSASGSRPQAGRPVTLMRSRHWDGVRS